MAINYAYDGASTEQLCEHNAAVAMEAQRPIAAKVGWPLRCSRPDPQWMAGVENAAHAVPKPAATAPGGHWHGRGGASRSLKRWTRT
jgi:hypothetical protein